MFLQKNKYPLFLSILFSLLSFMGCINDDLDPIIDEPDSEIIDRAVLMYIAAQNSLTESFTNDWQEILQGCKQMKRNQKIIALVDAYDTENNNYKPCTKLYILNRYSGDNPKPTLTFQENLDLTNPKTLAYFLKWVKNNIKAKEYALTFWSHSMGWLPAINTHYLTNKYNHHQPLHFGIDSNKLGVDNSKSMNIKALKEVLENSGLFFQFIFFDSCLMQNIEVAYELKNSAAYIIGSPMFIPGVGGDYEELIPKGFFSHSPITLAQTYFQVATNPKHRDVQNYQDVGIVISVIDTKHLDSLAKATNEALSTINLFSSIEKEPKEPDMTNVQTYLNYTSAQSYAPDFFDIKLAMKAMLSPTEYTKWLKAFLPCVIYKAGTSKFWGQGSYILLNENEYSGVSMFIPQNKYKLYTNLTPYKNLNQRIKETSWYTAVNWSQTQYLDFTKN